MSFTNLKYDFCLIYSNNQNTKVDTSDHGTWRKHLLYTELLV